MARAEIIGTGGYQPGDPITNDVIERLAGPLPDEIAAGLSIERRFWLIDPDTGEHHDSNSGMALKAVQAALAAAGVSVDEVELMILATGTPDFTLPPVANLVQEGLGLESCATLEIRSAGAGFVQGLDVARMYLEEGSYKTAVVIGSEAVSPALAPLYLGQGPESVRVRDKMPLYMFGDGAGAAVVRSTDGESGGLLGAAMSCIGGTRKPGIQVIGGATHAPIHQQLQARRPIELRVDSVGAGDFTPVMVTRALSDTLRKTGVEAESIDHCLIPEGTVGWMVSALEEKGLATPEWQAMEGKIFDNLSQMGACGCAAVPLFLDHAWRAGRIRQGDRVMLIGVEATKWIYAGMVLDWTAAPISPGSEQLAETGARGA